MWDFSKFGNRNAIIADSGECLTYADLKKIGDEITNVMEKRSLVFSFCTNTVGSLLGYASFVEHKMVALMLSHKLEKELRDNLIDNYKPQYLWIPSYMKNEFVGAKTVYEGFGYCLLRTVCEKGFELYEELALLLTTSGSTGSPKLVRQSYENIWENTKSIVDYLEITETEKAITTLPMNYTYGLSIINSHFAVGATMLVTDKTILQREFWDFFRKEGATSFGGVPYTYEMLDRLNFVDMELPSLRTMTQAGGKLSVELHEVFARYAKEKGKSFIVMYGQCEATARMSYLPGDKACEKIGSMGIVIPGGKFHLLDVAGNEIQEADIVGELVYEGKNVTLGYAEKGEDLCKGDERHGILHTGDMAKKDEDGYLYIVGRKKRFLKIYGNRVNLDEIERLVKTEFHPIECAGAGVDDHLYVFVTEETKKQEVRKFLLDKTGINKMALRIVVLDEIPKNDAGKTLYSKLDKYIEES